jgi:hypothetical protein
MFVKVFHVEWLATFLHQAAINHLVERAARTEHEPDDEYDAALQAAAEHVKKLEEDLTNHMIVTTGIQPDDRQ